MKTVLINTPLFTKPEVERAFRSVQLEMVQSSSNAKYSADGDQIYSFYEIMNTFSHFLGEELNSMLMI